MDEKIIALFEIPEEAQPYVSLFLSEDEIAAVLKMDKGFYLPGALEELLAPVVESPSDFIKAAYSRGVFNKQEQRGEVGYQAANFYRRLAFFAQYEPEVWQGIPRADREKMDLWYVKSYADNVRPRLEEALKDPSKLIENAYFVTLEDAFDVIDKLDHDPYMVPCNCKSVALNCDRPKNVCVLFDKGINSEWDRGHGKPLTKEEAKELIRFANKSGLMQTSELAHAICNCDACCCYPIRISEMNGTRGIWPKRVYDIVWDESACVNCGKCASLCHFGAFTKEDGKVKFHDEKCRGCTLCKSNCPKNAIQVRQGHQGRSPWTR